MMAMSNPAGADQEHRLTTPSNLCSFERYFKDYFAGQNAEFVVLPRSLVPFTASKHLSGNFDIKFNKNTLPAIESANKTVHVET